MLSMLAQMTHDLLRKVGFAERRQQRQLPSLAEVNREFEQAFDEGPLSLCCCFLETAHFYFLANTFMGCLCFPVHSLMLFCSCCYWSLPKLFGRGVSSERVEELEIRLTELQLQLDAAEDGYNSD